MPKITTNFIYNVALTLSTYLINLILFPYVSRVLGVDMVGKVGFVNETVNYFSLFAVMGVATVGIREIAACGDDREKRSRVFSSLMAIVGVLTFGVTLVYLGSLFVVNRFQADRNLFVIGTGTLLFTSLLIEWFYQGMENFRYITIRSILVKLAYAAAVFLTVRRPEDYLIYFALTVGAVIVNAVINIGYSRRYATLSLHNVDLKAYLKPVFSLGMYKVMVSMFTTFNVIYLGFVSTETECGYYYTSKKLFYLVLGIFSAFAAVMLPRMSSMLADRKSQEFSQKIDQSFDIVFAFAIPLIVLFVLMAPQIIILMSGSGYEGAVTPMRILSPVLLVTTMAQIWTMQILIPMRKDRVILVTSAIGAFLGILVNILLVKRLGAVGSALVLLISETAGNLYSFFYVIRNGYLVFPTRKFLTFLLGSIPYVLCCLAGMAIPGSVWAELMVACGLMAFYFLIFNGFLYKRTLVNRYLISALSLLKRWL